MSEREGSGAPRQGWRGWLLQSRKRVPTKQQVWRRVSKFSRRLEVVARPTTYLLASIGLLSVYFPGLKRIWEEFAMPTAWYQVGVLRLSSDKDANGRQPILMVGGTYDAAAWNGGVRLPDLFEIKGQDIRTEDVGVGRRDESIRASVKAVLGANQCLHVSDISFVRFRPGYERGDARAFGPQAASRLSKMANSQPSYAEPFLRSAIGNPRACQPLTKEEESKGSGAASKGGVNWSYSYDKRLAVCPRIVVWVKAAKVTC